MLRPKNCKKCGGKMRQTGGIQTYTQSNTPQGGITPTGQSNAARLTPEQIRAMAGQFGFRTDSNANLQQDLFNYAQQNQPQAYQAMTQKYGPTAAGTFVDDMLGARTSELLSSLTPPQQQQPAPQPYRVTSTFNEHMFGPGNRALGAASNRYRDSYDVTDAGMVDTGNPREYVNFRFYKPNSTEFDESRGTYRIPNDVYMNQIARGTTTIANPDLLNQYRLPDNLNIVPSSSTAAVGTKKKGGFYMKGGKLVFQVGGTAPNQQDYPDYESWAAAMDEWTASQQGTPTAPPPTPPVNMNAFDNIQGIQAFQPTATMVDSTTWDPMSDPNTPTYAQAQRNPPRPNNNNPYQTLQNIGIGMRAVRTGLGEIAGRVERGRQNQYDYQQQTALGMMNPMQSDDFQPNPYNLYMQYGGNLRTILKDFNKFSNDAQMDMGDGKLDNHGKMKKGGYEIDRMIIVRKLLPELLKLGRLGSGKYRNYKRGGMEHGGNPAMAPFHNLSPEQYAQMLQMMQMNQGILPVDPNNPMEGFHMMPDGEMMADSEMSGYAKGGIHIKKKNRGKFTEYCGGKVTDECIQRGLNSSNPITRKRANFARNARKWN
jgi:hypothetical protein